MTAKDLIILYSDIESLGIPIWFDEGWGVDALVERETRSHKDVVMVIQEKDLPKLKIYLQDHNYTNVETDDATDWNFVMGNDKGLLIDIHVIVLDEKGNGIYGPIENGVMYLKGTGMINNKVVNCLSADYQILSHTGYQIKDKDFQDVSALCSKFNLPLPSEYK